MTIHEIIEAIKLNYKDDDIQFLADKMDQGDLSVRKQLADMVCMKSSGLMPAKMIHEISKWGVTDNLSVIKEIRELNNQ